ncbi:MAG: hypothetical protein QXL15_02065 [Candidatus Korarchaeota archaeon]
MSVTFKYYRSWEVKKFHGPLTRVFGAAIDVLKHGFSYTSTKIFAALAFLVGPGAFLLLVPFLQSVGFGIGGDKIFAFKNFSYLIASSAFSTMPQLFVTFFMSNVLSDEFKNDAIQLYLARPVYRSEYIFARMLAGWLATFLILGLPAGISNIVMMYAMNIEGEQAYTAMTFSLRIFTAVNLTLFIYLEIIYIICAIVPRYKPGIISFAALLMLSVMALVLGQVLDDANYTLLDPSTLVFYSLISEDLKNIPMLGMMFFAGISIDAIFCFYATLGVICGLFIALVMISWRASGIWGK